ncbi:MAG: gamma-glutamyltransferase [Deltaproteobacteria bacterium]|nr:MAG: gamma-glutamyltransferase [Deltaproteobacteria bacterium]
MEFTYQARRMANSFAQRSVVMGPSGMVASSQYLASLSGYKALSRGGNAVDAAVAMVSTLNVVEPHSVGIGGDAFALIYLRKENKIVGMNASGRAPYRASIPWFLEKGIKTIPERGILSVTVPGALHGWNEAVERYGNLGLGNLLEDAINYAENGFPVTEVIAGEWKHMEEFLQSHKGTSQCYLINGKAPFPGQLFRNRDLARTLKAIARDGIDTFYGGKIGRAIVDFSDSQGGLLSLEDFRDHTTTWVEPISTDYRGYTVYELPPNGQGITALELLNILEGYDLTGLGHNSPEYLHLFIEAKKIAFSDRDHFVTDPEFEDIPIDTLLSKDYAKRCREKIDTNRAKPAPAPFLSAGGSDTVYVTAVDSDRNAVSFISSIFMPFGSGMVVDGTGILLQNRGKSFSLNPHHYNKLQPHKRPMHTIIPGMVFRDGRFLMCFGVMGGDMQPQGHAQFLINLIDFKMNLQEALDAPRIRHMEGMDVYLEDGIPEQIALALQEKGHHILKDTPPVNQVGGGQAIYLDHSQNTLLGASDRRKDGCAIGY